MIFAAELLPDISSFFCSKQTQILRRLFGTERSPWVTRSGTSAVKVAAAAAFSESLFMASYPINPATFSLGESPSSTQVSLDSSILTVLMETR